MNHRARHPALALASGFTLVELIVAVAAVALLTVGIGQIFSSVGRLVGAGTALAETDQFARSIESQMRADFAALSELRAEETFFVVRSRRLGDLDRGDDLDSNEKAVYLNSDDKEFDRKEGILPYAAKSRAITVRLDEMMFIAEARGDAATSQRIPPNLPQPGKATHVRLYYGHGLRPPIDRGFNPLDPPAVRTGNVPPRLYFADGDFGDRAGINNRYFPSSGAPVLFEQTQGRNEYAGDWLLLRQPLLLSGGLAAGSGAPPPGAAPSEWMYSPFIRGLECRERSFAGWGDPDPMDDALNATPSPASGLEPFARVLYHGRTDVCAQNRDDAQRWLEGLNPGNGAPPNTWEDASAFDGGLLDGAGANWDPTIPGGFPSSLIDAPLWQREIAGAVEEINHQRLISAIAGCLARSQAEDDPPMLERFEVLTTAAGATAEPAPRPRFQQVMDMHAVVASRVSNFEIAWTDGEKWSYDTSFDRNNDDDPTDADRDGDFGLADNLNRGDVIWHDMDFWRDHPGNAFGRSLADPAADPAGLYSTEPPITSPEVIPGERDLMINTNVANPERYDLDITGAADPNDPDGNAEYLAIFPFRTVDPGGGYQDAAFRKPTSIRVRMTVHDAQFRLPGGRQYEFEFPIDLK